jgi:hypothetical protein
MIVSSAYLLLTRTSWFGPTASEFFHVARRLVAGLLHVANENLVVNPTASELSHDSSPSLLGLLPVADENLVVLSDSAWVLP